MAHYYSENAMGWVIHVFQRLLLAYRVFLPLVFKQDVGMLIQARYP